MKHVCVVTSAHPWDDVRVSSRIAASLRDADYRLTWVGPDRSFVVDDDLKLKGVDYRLFPVGQGRIERLRGASRAFRRARGVSDVDWWYSPDPDMAARLPRLARRAGGQTLFDIHESYHGGLLERWFPGGKPPQFVRDLMRRKIAATARKVDLVMGVSARVLELYCVDQPNVVVVRNLAPASFAPEQPEIVAPARMRVMHGKLAAGNGTEQVARAFAELDSSTQADVQVVMLRVLPTAETVSGMVASVASGLAPDTISVIPAVAHEQMAGLMATCSVGLISYQRDLGYESLPNRLFEYMAAGLAIIAPSYSPEIVKILDAEQIGLTADFEDPSDIARQVEWCVKHPKEVAAMGARARAAYLQRYTWDTESQGLIAAMTATAGG